jgi:ribosomal protein S18 acetylase RimI-like enzyme
MLTIRECRDSDLAPLEQHLPAGGRNVHAFHHAEQLAGRCRFLTAWENDLPVGSCLVLWTGPFDVTVREAMPDAVELSQLHVHPDARGRGVGTALIRFAEEQVAARGGDTVTIAVAADNPRAAALYVRLGYEDTGIRWTARYRVRDGPGVERDVEEHNTTLAKRLG